MGGKLEADGEDEESLVTHSGRGPSDSEVGGFSVLDSA